MRKHQIFQLNGSIQQMDERLKILQLLSSKTRFEILNKLLIEPDYTINLAKKLNLESSIVTHALKPLEKQGIVCSYRVKKLKYYQVTNSKKLQEIFLNLEILRIKDEKT
jgi:DNA-binding transcriptional ArsR family regulator